MKYLKQFNEVFNKEHTQKVFESIIRWDMIQDVKDMSLEYLDMNMKLYLGVCYKSKVRLADLYEINYTHGLNKSYWGPIPEYCAKFPNPDKLLYSIIIYEPCMSDGWTRYDRNEGATNEIVDRIREMYPEMKKNIYGEVVHQDTKRFNEDIDYLDTRDIEDIFLELKDQGFFIYFDYVDVNEAFKDYNNYDQYLELVDTLQGEIFDEHFISFSEAGRGLNNGKFWTYSYNYHENTIECLHIFGVDLEERNQIIKELKSVRRIVKGRSDLEYRIEARHMDEDEFPFIKRYYYINIKII